jgi:hypothetical protein
VGTFADDVMVVPAGEGRYSATLDHSWDLVPLPQGGVVASFALRAAAAEVGDPAQSLRTCTTVFAGQVTAGELEVDVRWWPACATAAPRAAPRPWPCSARPGGGPRSWT